MSDDSICNVFFQITYNVGDRILFSALYDSVQVIGHHYESVQLESLSETHTIQAVDDQAFHYVVLEGVLMLDGAGGDEI